MNKLLIVIFMSSSEVLAMLHIDHGTIISDLKSGYINRRFGPFICPMATVVLTAINSFIADVIMVLPDKNMNYG